MVNKITIPFTGNHKNREELGTDEGVLVLEKISTTLKDRGYCYVEVIGGDYNGSVAKFTPDILEKDKEVVTGRYTHGGKVIINYWWGGRLSWDGKKNNPSFTLISGSCLFIENYDGPTVFVRKDFKSIKEDLLKTEVEDIDGNILNVGDEVLYMNLRYGNGGKLSKGVILEFKPHARKNYVSVIVSNSQEDGEKSELSYPSYQIYKLQNNTGGK